MTIDERLKEIEERLKNAHREICDLASGKRKWEMCIPPQPTDSDMILQAPLDDLAKLIEMVRVAMEALSKPNPDCVWCEGSGWREDETGYSSNNVLGRQVSCSCAVDKRALARLEELAK